MFRNRKRIIFCSILAAVIIAVGVITGVLLYQKQNPPLRFADSGGGDASESLPLTLEDYIKRADSLIRVEILRELPLKEYYEVPGIYFDGESTKDVYGESGLPKGHNSRFVKFNTLTFTLFEARVTYNYYTDTPMDQKVILLYPATRKYQLEYFPIYERGQCFVMFTKLNVQPEGSYIHAKGIFEVIQTAKGEFLYKAGVPSDEIPSQILDVGPKIEKSDGRHLVRYAQIVTLEDLLAATRKIKDRLAQEAAAPEESATITPDSP